ncbi:unnamed protein product [Pylaiella littoralis]
MVRDLGVVSWRQKIAQPVSTTIQQYSILSTSIILDDTAVRTLSTSHTYRRRLPWTARLAGNLFPVALTHSVLTSDTTQTIKPTLHHTSEVNRWFMCGSRMLSTRSVRSCPDTGKLVLRTSNDILPLYHKSGLLGLYAPSTVSDVFGDNFFEIFGVF